MVNIMQIIYMFKNIGVFIQAYNAYSVFISHDSFMKFLEV